MNTESGFGARPRIAVVGAGAVGCYFGGMLARAGARVTLIGRPTHVDAILRDGLWMEGLRINERIPVLASTEISAARDAGIILFCVKTVDTESVARSLQAYLPPGSTVLSLQNGVDNVERMRAAAQIDAIPAIVYVAAAMAGPGHIKHSGRGDLIIGHLPGASPASGHPKTDLDALAPLFERAEIPCRVSQDIRADLWSKMILNCAFNAISALARVQYGAILRSAQTRVLMEQAVIEAVAVARAEGVPLSESGMIDATFKLGKAMPAARSSTAQDIDRGKPTEIDSLNGYVVRRAAALGLKTPINQTLHTLVKLLEQNLAAPR